MNISDQQLWDVYRGKEHMFSATNKDAPRGVAQERLFAATLEQWGLPANPENMGRMREIYITREFRVQM
jgi:hypothetical protein